MAKKSSPVFYCGFCDMTLAKSEGVVYNTIHYCNDMCLKLGKKTSVTDDGLNILRRNVDVLRGGISRQDIKLFAKKVYEALRKSYEEVLAENNPKNDYSSYKMELCIYGHVHNGNKEKAIKALERFNDWSSENFEEMCVNPDGHRTVILCRDEREISDREEGIRISGIMYKLKREIFKLLIEQM